MVVLPVIVPPQASIKPAVRNRPGEANDNLLADLRLDSVDVARFNLDLREQAFMLHLAQISVARNDGRGTDAHAELQRRDHVASLVEGRRFED
jgi:hypothetical protein